MERIPVGATLLIVIAALALAACDGVKTTPTPTPTPAPTMTPTTASPAATPAGQSAPESAPLAGQSPTPATVATLGPTASPTRVADPTPSSTRQPAQAPKPEITPAPISTVESAGTQTVQRRWAGPAGCSGEDVTFTAPPVDLDEVWYIEPQGKLHSSHVTPTDHTYVNHNRRPAFESHHNAVRAGQAPEAWSPPYDVMSPADGYITNIEAFPFGPAPYGFTGTLEDYRVIIWHTCAVSTIFIHLGGLSPEVLAVTGEIGSGGRWSPAGGVAVPVKAGQAVGKVGGQGVDFSVRDTRITLDGFVVPSHYETEPWKIHTADPFDYYEGTLRSQMLAKNPRTAEPRGGKIEYNIDGRLVGNWFLDGTVDYSGGSKTEMCGTRPCPYWTGHLSIAYDHIDPEQIRISIGADAGITEDQCRVCQSVYGVTGNAPDPAAVSVASGLVKYELAARQKVGELGLETRNIDSENLGAFLVQMLDDRSIKMEVVAGQTAAETTGFSDAANIYRR